MIKVSHEVPLKLLEESRSFNDYDYALVHLFETHSDYFEFYKESIRKGRDVLLDNSIFELGESFSFEKFVYWIKELLPTRYIIPDVMYDDKRTVDNILKWKNMYSDLPGKTIGVVQGKSYVELTRCYMVISHYCDEVSINMSKMYKANNHDPNKSDDFNIMRGRQELISRWIKDGVIDYKMKHHLLGCMLPQEFEFYKDMDFITSLDTSNPIVHGLLKIKYKNGGLESKEKVLLADLIDSKINKKQRKIIDFNIQEFKKIIGR